LISDKNPQDIKVIDLDVKSSDSLQDTVDLVFLKVDYKSRY
ncbi:5552_t:CDS:1, partial [Racocetra fulgida]